MNERDLHVSYFPLKVFAFEHVHSAYGTADSEVGQGILSFNFIKMFHCPVLPSHSRQKKKKKINKYLLLSYLKEPSLKQ